MFRHYAAALKPGAPFVFTYHHNDPAAYVAVVVAILDAGLDCTATLPRSGNERFASHSGDEFLILDSIFVCRRVNATHQTSTVCKKHWSGTRHEWQLPASK